MDATDNEIIHYWCYFCSLCDRLEATRQYVDHSFNNNKFKNGNVNSFEFQQLIMLAASEFENLCKVICSYFDNDFVAKNIDIKVLSDKILTYYPKIIETNISMDYQTYQPLINWSVDYDKSGNVLKVNGLKWWKAYNKLKHESYNYFDAATLENAVDSLASLMIIELYLMKITSNSVNLSLSKPCKYFENIYESDRFISNEKPLPGFEKQKVKE